MTHCEIIVAPPFTALAASVEAAAGSPIAIAAQNVYWASEGAFTGEVSPKMLVETGCRAVIIAHSERRQFFGETDETANRKVKAALAAELTPILCVGETLAEREAGQMRTVLERQFRGSLAALTGAEFSRIIVAYEPVWAIGTGRTATPEMAAEAHRFLRELAAGSFYPGSRCDTKDPLRRKRKARQHQRVDGAGGYRRGPGRRRELGRAAVRLHCEFLAHGFLDFQSG